MTTGANGSINSITVLSYDNSAPDQVLLAGMFSKAGNMVGNSPIGSWQTGVVQCTQDGTCGSNNVLPLNGVVNLIALTKNNQPVISGEYSTLKGIAGATTNGVLAKASYQSPTLTSDWTSLLNGNNAADNSINAFFDTSIGYFLGGKFAQIGNNGTNTAITNSECGNGGGKSCMLALVAGTAASPQITDMFDTDGAINAITAGASLSISKQ